MHTVCTLRALRTRSRRVLRPPARWRRCVVVVMMMREERRHDRAFFSLRQAALTPTHTPNQHTRTLCRGSKPSRVRCRERLAVLASAGRHCARHTAATSGPPTTTPPPRACHCCCCCCRLCGCMPNTTAGFLLHASALLALPTATATDETTDRQPPPSLAAAAGLT